MPRRRARKLLIAGAVAPADLSRTVVGKYVSEAKVNLGDWANRYQANIRAYLGETKRQELAQTKLATWYDIYVTEVYPRIKEIFATARAAFIRRIYKPAVASPPA